MNTLENPEILSPIVLNAIDYLLLKSPEDLVFGGSLALNAIGIINRPVKDLDIIIADDGPLYFMESILKKTENGDEYITETDIDGTKVHRYAAQIHEVKVCFFVKKNIESHLTTQIGTRQLKLGPIKDTIAAKKKYLDNPKIKPESFEKHTADIKAYESLIDDIPF